MSNKIMTPEHPEWDAFIDKLAGPEGVNGTDASWVCYGDHRQAIAILETMPGIDIEQTLDYFCENGGYCDCEILLNVYAADLERKLNRGNDEPK